MVWVIGADGLLGREVIKALKGKNIPCVGTDKEVDAENFSLLETFLKKTENENYYSHRKFKNPNDGKITWIVNCASLSDYRECEENPEKAEAANAKAALNIARLSHDNGAKMIHVSTSYVFGGDNAKSMKENDRKDPFGVFGKTKALGEDYVRSSLSRCYIIRTSKIFGEKKGTFVPSLIRAMTKNPELHAIKDSSESFTSAKDLASFIVLAIEKSDGAKKLFGKKSAPSYGVYNFANSGSASLFEFVKEVSEIAKKIGIVKNEINVLPSDITDNGTNLQYPKNLVLDCSLTEKEFKIKIPSWRESLKKIFGGMR